MPSVGSSAGSSSCTSAIPMLLVCYAAGLLAEAVAPGSCAPVPCLWHQISGIEAPS
jgi:hypothetical protein